MATETLRINITADNKAAIAGVTQVKNTVDGLTESIKVYQDKAFAEKDVEKLKKYNREIQVLQAQLKQTGNIGKVGFDEMGVAIKNSSAGLGGLLTPVRQLAYILPGIGMAGIFSLAFEGIEKLATGFNDASDGAKKFADEYVKAMTSAEQSSQKEIATVQSLISVATNESLSKRDRTRALKELNKEYPGYFTNLSKDLTDTEKLKRITNDLSAAIIRKGNAEALAGLIGKENAKIWEQEHMNVEQQVDQLSTASKVWEFFKGSISSASPAMNAAASATNLVSAAVDNSKDIIKQAAANVKSLTEELNKNTLEQIQNNDFVKEGTKNLKAKMSEAEKWAKFLERFKGKMAAGFAAQENIPQVFAPKEKEQKATPLGKATDYEAGMKKAKNWLEDIDKANKQALENGAKYANVAANAFSNLFDQMKAGMSIGDALSNMFADLANQIAKAAVKALIFKIVLDVFSGGVSAGAGGIGFGDIFKNLLGGGGGLGKGFGKGFAQGGIATGPKSGHLELLHGTEAIMTPAQVNGLFNAGVQTGSVSGAGMGERTINVVGRVMGQDIWLSQQRTQYNRNLTT